jgi:hypothetical protein
MVGASPIQNILGRLSEITFKALPGLDSPDLKSNISENINIYQKELDAFKTGTSCNIVKNTYRFF